ncbi:MAG: coproporphyrinogen dehydrogenase HemZ [Lachnospiraceae bacterium]|nr:coproporphyrinogen dehydrogenase HemZ [Lachnospiraceae bacterium]
MFGMMIWGVDFEQDLKPLIKAFYPGCDFTVKKGELQGNLCGRAEWISFLNDAFALTGKEGFWPDYAFYLMEADGYFAVRQGDTWVTDEFHIRGRKDETIKEEVYHREYRNSLMRPLYRVLERVSGICLPWGILTGIRPTKQVLERLENGVPGEEIIRFMREEYFCTDEKIATSLSVARTEWEILKGMDYQEGYSMYIGIPFCPSTCYYCSFPSYPLAVYGGQMEEYLKALFKEIRYAGRQGTLFRKHLQTIYVGGGTPTTLSAEQLDRLFTCMEENLDLSFVKEITVEAGRPDSITKEKLSILRSHGIRRISINPQTMKQETLDLIGRRHTVEEICETFYMARELGFDNINMDIILGLAKETPQDVAETLARIGELSPDNLTVHTLAVKRAARLNTNREEYVGLEASGVQEMLRISRVFAEENGYHPYYLYRQKNMTENLENVGYAKQGKEGLYNILIMEEKQTILALGAGATTKFVMPGGGRMVRVENVKSLKDYIGRIDEMIARKENFLCEYRDRL